MLNKAASLILEYRDTMDQLSAYRAELYDCAEIPHIFDLLAEENLLQTYQNDKQAIDTSLEYMQNTHQTTLHAETLKAVNAVWNKIQALSKRLKQQNVSFLKIQVKLDQSNTRISSTLLEQLDSLNHIVNRYFILL